MPNHAEFSFKVSDPEELKDIVAGGRSLYVPSSGIAQGGVEQHLPVFITPPIKQRRDGIILRGPGFGDDMSNMSGRVFDAVVAQEAGQTVVAINPPGITLHEKIREITGASEDDDRPIEQGKLTEAQKDLLNSGYFRGVGFAVMSALYTSRLMGQIPEDEKVMYYNSSMGTAIGGAALQSAAEYGITFDGVILGEGVTYEHQGLIRLMNRFRKELKDISGYSPQNPDEIREHSEPQSVYNRRMIQNAAANWAYGQGLAKGKFFDEFVSRKLKSDKTPVTVAWGTATRLSGDDVQRAAAARIRGEHGLEVVEKAYDGHTHNYMMTVGSAIDTIRIARKAYDSK